MPLVTLYNHLPRIQFCAKWSLPGLLNSLCILKCVNSYTRLQKSFVELSAIDHLEAMHELQQSRHLSVNHVFHLSLANRVLCSDFHLKIVSPFVAHSVRSLSLIQKLQVTANALWPCQHKNRITEWGTQAGMSVTSNSILPNQ